VAPVSVSQVDLCVQAAYQAFYGAGGPGEARMPEMNRKQGKVKIYLFDYAG